MIFRLGHSKHEGTFTTAPPCKTEEKLGWPMKVEKTEATRDHAS